MELRSVIFSGLLLISVISMQAQDSVSRSMARHDFLYAEPGTSGGV